MKKILTNIYFILGLILAPLILLNIMNKIFNDNMPRIIKILCVFLLLLGLILLLIKLLKYSSEKSGKSIARTIISIVIKILIFYIIFFIMAFESGKQISEMGLILPLIK